MDTHMKNISVRLTFLDIQNVKELSSRLKIRESDLFRLSIKNILAKLVPLNDKNLKGVDLIPIWLECGDFLMDSFYFDAKKLDDIFNQDVEEADKRIDIEDIEMMAMSKLNPIYLIKKLSALCEKPIDPMKTNEIFKNYLYNKYIVGSKYSYDAV